MLNYCISSHINCFISLRFQNQQKKDFFLFTKPPPAGAFAKIWKQHLLTRCNIQNNKVCCTIVLRCSQNKCQVVGSFAIQDETTNAISEALPMLKSWNLQWQPRCFMIDNYDEEISAIRQNFPCEYVNVFWLI